MAYENDPKENITFNNPEYNEQTQEILAKSAEGKIWTPANMATFSRPVLGGMAAFNLITGQPNASVWMAATAASDAEGQIARFFDRHFPQLQLGSSKLGEKLDPIADTAAMLEVATGALVGPMVNWQAKVGVGIIGGKELRKAAWAAYRRKQWMDATEESDLVLKANSKGKLGTVGGFGAVMAACVVNDLGDPYNPVSEAVGYLGIGSAVAGTISGELALKQYDKKIMPIIEEYRDLNS